MNITEKDLKPGDCLTYSGTSQLSKLIERYTFSKASHSEMYVGNGHTITSRDAGAEVYELDLTNLYAVQRPVLPFDVLKGLDAFYDDLRGKPYGWLALMEFANIQIPEDGVFCSESVLYTWRSGGFDPFNSFVMVNKVSPSMILTVNESILKYIWVSDES